MKLLLITAAIILLVFLLYFYCIMPRFTRKSQTRAFMHRLFAHRGLFDPKEGIPENSLDRKSTRLNSSHLKLSRMPSSA